MQNTYGKRTGPHQLQPSRKWALRRDLKAFKRRDDSVNVTALSFRMVLR